MKKSIAFIVAAAFAAALSACSSDDVDSDIGGVNHSESTTNTLKLTGRINALNQITKADAAGFEIDDKVGVYVVTDGSLKDSGNHVDNKAFTYATGGALTPPSGSEVYWATSSSRLGVFAYYPYDGAINSVSAYPFAVAADQSSEEALYESDFLWASAANLAPQKEAVNLSFNHKLSKINVTLVAGNGFESDALAAAQKTFTITGVGIDGTIDLSTGIATVGDEKKSITPLATGDMSFSAIIYPQTTQATFKVVVNGSTYAYSTETTFAAGNQYNYTLTISQPDKLSLTTNGVVEWENGGNESGDMSGIITGLSPQFKEYLLGETLIIYDDVSGGYNDTENKIDADGDGEISFVEAENVEYISFFGNANNPEELKGLEFFPNLTYLSIYNISNSSLDVSNNTALTSLYCSENQLTSLDVSNNTALTRLDCYSNQLTSLDVSNNTALEHLTCDNNQLTTLDVSKNTALTKLACYSNQLTSLDVSNNTALEELYCDNNQLTTLDVSKNTALTILDCCSNQLTTLDVSKNTALESLDCYSNQLTSLDVSNNTALTNLNCHTNQLTTLDVSNNTALYSLVCNGNQLTSLDVSNNTALTYLYCNNNQLTSLDVSKNTALTNLSCSGNSTDFHLTALAGLFSCSPSPGTITWVDDKGNTITIPANDPVVEMDEEIKRRALSYCDINNDGNISQTEAKYLKYLSIRNFPESIDFNLGLNAFTNLEYLTIRGDMYSNTEYDLDLTTFSKLRELSISDLNLSDHSLDLSGLQYLEEIIIRCTSIEHIDLSDCPKLTTIYMDNTPSFRGNLLSIDLKNSSAITYLALQYNNLTELDLSTNIALETFSCEGNNLSTLDVSNNTALTRLFCSANQLTSLDVSNNTALTYLSCSTNQLTSLDVSNNTALTYLSCRNNPITKIYLKTGQEIEIYKPNDAVIEYK